MLGLKAGIKWPNDLLIRERKICGILMEISAEVGRLDYAVVGLGINANVRLSSFPEEWMSHLPGPQSWAMRYRACDLIQRILHGDRRGIRKDGLKRDL